MSLWWSLVDRPAISVGDLEQSWDVLIVGGGFSGLWCAHHLISADPNLKVAVLEKGLVGSGASGRNGGWASALYPMNEDRMHENFSHENISQLHEFLRKTIDDISDFVEHESIACGFTKGGSLTVARNKGQLQRMHRHLEEGYEYLNAEETKSHIRMEGALGSIFTPHCACLNPAALVVGLAQSLEKRGVAIFENTWGEISSAGTVLAQGVSLHAKFVVRAVEAYHDRSRDQVPIYSLMVATEPLPPAVFEEIGLTNRETFAEASHLITYAQRTPDNRLAIGGRGAPYGWGSRRNDRKEHGGRDHERIRQLAHDWFPILKDFEFTHSWGGAVGVTRDWGPYVRTLGNYGEMGGYAGDGVAFSYLAAEAMTDLILGHESEKKNLPFVQWRNPRWEPEPLRWLAINGAIKLSALADAEEARLGRPSQIMKFLAKVTGQ